MAEKMFPARAHAVSPATESYDDSSWWLLGLIMLIFGVFQLIDPFTFAVLPLASAAVFWVALAAAGRFYTYVRPKAQFAAMFDGLLQILVFSAFGAALSYMVAAQGGAYWDEQLRNWDAALGLDWRRYLDWVSANPSIATLYRLAYVSLIPQMIVLIVALGFANRLHALRIAVFAAMLSGFATVLISGLTPAVSNFVSLGLTPADVPNLNPAAAWSHLADLEGLRDGSLRHFVFNRAEGIVTFPSYHAALATVFAWGFLHAPVARWPGFITAVLTILATPVDGAHYFVDVLAGMAVAAVSIAIAYMAVPLRLPLPRLRPLRAKAPQV